MDHRLVGDASRVVLYAVEPLERRVLLTAVVITPNLSNSYADLSAANQYVELAPFTSGATHATSIGYPVLASGSAQIATQLTSSSITINATSSMQRYASNFWFDTYGTLSAGGEAWLNFDINQPVIATLTANVNLSSDAGAVTIALGTEPWPYISGAINLTDTPESRFYSGVHSGSALIPPREGGWTLLVNWGTGVQYYYGQTAQSKAAFVQVTLNLKPLPPVDLRADFGSGIPTALRRGDSFTPSLLLRNIGSMEINGGSDTSYYLNRAANLNGQEILLGSELNQLHLISGQALTEQPVLTIPGTVDFGDYYLISKTDTALYAIDPDSGAHVAIQESDAPNYANNIAVAGPIKITKPDLRGTFTTVPTAILKGDVLGGEDLPLTLNLVNSAPVPADSLLPLDIEFYLSTNGLIDSSDVLLTSTPGNGEYGAFHMNAGESRDWNGTVNIPYDDQLDVSRQYFLLARIDASNDIEETNDDVHGFNNNKAFATTKLLPKVVNVVIHGFGSTLFGPSFYEVWDGIAQQLETKPLPGTLLYNNIKSYAPHWSSTDGWPEVVIGKLLQLWKYGDQPIEFDHLNKLIQYGLSVSRRHADDAAWDTVDHLTQTGMLLDPERTWSDDANPQVIHLIGHSRGGSVAAHVAQILEERGYEVAEYTALDGYGIDWPGISATFGDVSIPETMARLDIPLKENFLVEQSLSVALPGMLEQMVAQKTGFELSSVLMNPDALAFVTSLMADWRAPQRVGFDNVLVDGDPGNPSSHVNIGQYYRQRLWEYTALTFETTHLTDLPPAGTTSATARSVPAVQSLNEPSPLPEELAANFLDGSFEEVGAAIAGAIDIDASDVDDPFFSAWLSLVQDPRYLMQMTWSVTGDVHVVTGGNGVAAELHFDGSTIPSVAQTLVLPPINVSDGYYVDLDLELISAEPGCVLTLNGVPWAINGDGHYSIPLSLIDVVGDASTALAVGIVAPPGEEATVLIDNLAITSHPKFVWQEPETGILHVTFTGDGLPITVADTGGVSRATRGGPNDAAYDLSNIINITQAVVVEGSSTDDALTWSLPWEVQMQFNGAGGNDTIALNDGDITFANDVGDSGSNVIIDAASSASLIFPMTQHLAALNLNGGRALLSEGTGSTLIVASLNLTHDSQLDLMDNDLILDYTGDSPAGDIEALVGAGYHGGDWLGTGIISSVAAADGNYTVGVADNALLTTAYTSFSGVTVDATTVLIKFTWVCDLDLDGLVTANDAILFGNNYSPGDPTARMFGDMDFDGIFTTNDAILFGNNYDDTLPQV
jgi:hypothetical protein